MKDNKEKDKEQSLLLTSALAVGFGVFAMPYTAVLGVGCMAVGVTGVAMHLADPICKLLFRNSGEYYEEVGKIVEIIKINKIENKSGDPLKVKSVENTDNGFKVEFDIPLGLSYRELDMIIPAISCSMGGKKVKRNRNTLDVVFTELEKEYPLVFPPVRKEERYRLLTYVGNTINGPKELDLMHAGAILLAGQTGSGKSTVLRYMLTHIAVNYREDEINLYLNDMKYTELAMFKALKITKWHNTDPNLVLTSLLDFQKEMYRRYKLFESVGPDCTDAYEYERITGNKLPINLMVIEEFTILNSKEYKDTVEVLNDVLSKCRASKSHVIITTQRPDIKNFDPRLKANATHTIGLKTKSVTNSQIICDEDVLKYLRGNGHGYLFDNEGDTEFQGYYLKSSDAKHILEPYNKSREEYEAFINEQNKKCNIYEVDEYGYYDGDDDF